MKFLLPSRIPQYDFQFELLRANEFYKWKNGYEFKIEYGDADESYCPVGSVEFCRNHGITCSPVNIPFELTGFAYGENVFTDVSALNPHERYYVKSRLIIKDERNGAYFGNKIPFENNTFCAVRYLDSGFISEWRCFVMDGKLLDIKQYAAEDDKALFTVPDRDTVMKMISAYRSAPCAYTLDIGIAPDGRTYIIEAHDFFACGLYKFDDQYRLPQMLWNWYVEYRQKKAVSDAAKAEIR